MSSAMSVPEILKSRHDFLEMVKQRIWAHPCNFSDSWKNLTSPPDKKDHRIAAGVLMPLFFDTFPYDENDSKEPFSLMLIKRSNRVAQPGDLSFPGGILSNTRDRLLSIFFKYLLFPLSGRGVFAGLKKNRSPNARLIELFAATSLRESWEEIGLSPFCTQMLGPLPTYNLIQFKRTIFPLVGFIDSFGPLRPNREVEKLVRIPLASFYKEDNIGSIMIAKSTERSAPPVEFPCLIHQGSDGEKEILWGATFNISVEFLKIVLDYQLPATRKGEVVSRTLSSAYLSDRADK